MIWILASKSSGHELRAVKGKWKGLCYVDLLAGGGKCILRDSNREFDGSPLLALECTDPPFTTVVLVEADQRLTDALRARTANASDRAIVIEGDCNASAIIRRIRQLVPADALSIVFVDNLGLDVTFSTISRVVAGRAMDLVVTFQVSDLKRNAGSALTNDTEAGRWDRFWFEGGDSYLDVDRNNFDQLNRRTRFSSVEHFIARRNQTKDFWFDPVATKSQPERAGVDSEPAVG